MLKSHQMIVALREFNLSKKESKKLIISFYHTLRQSQAEQVHSVMEDWNLPSLFKTKHIYYPKSIISVSHA